MDPAQNLQNSYTRRAILATVASDSHTWNLVYLQLLLEESGFDVMNLGACTPTEEIIRSINTDEPDLVVISSVNGHGAREARGLGQAIRASGYRGPAVIGGKLGCGDPTDRQIPSKLRNAGFDAVYGDDDAADKAIEFHQLLKAIPRPKESLGGA